MVIRAVGGYYDYISVNNQSCAVWWDGSVHVSGSGVNCHCLIIVRLHAPAEYIHAEAKDQFHAELLGLPRRVHLLDIVIVASAFNSQLGYLRKREQRIRGSFLDPNDCVVNIGYLNQGCFFGEHKLCHKKRQRLIWNHSPPSGHWTQIGHTAIGHPWVRPVDDFR